MKIPTDLDIDRLMHRAGLEEIPSPENLLRTVKVTVRESRSSDPPDTPRRARTKITLDARAVQRQDLAGQISMTETRLKRLDAKIAERLAEERAEDRKTKARRERAAKERDKPISAAEKAQAAREVRQRKLKHAATQDASLSGGGDIRSAKQPSAAELQALATKVRGQIAVAKQKLAAL